MNDSWDEIWNLRASLYGFFGDSLLEPMQGQHTVTFSKEFWRDFPLEAANAQMKAGLEQLINCSTFLDGFSDEEATENILWWNIPVFFSGRDCQKPLHVNPFIGLQNGFSSEVWHMK